MSRILLIEPDTVLAKIYRNALEHYGYEVELADGAQKAVESADNKKPDVIIMEMQLAGHNGFEFLYEFRSYPDWQSIPVIVHSVVPFQQLSSSKIAAQLHIAVHLYKPQTSLEKLINSVQTVIYANSKNGEEKLQ